MSDPAPLYITVGRVTLEGDTMHGQEKLDTAVRVSVRTRVPPLPPPPPPPPALPPPSPPRPEMMTTIKTASRSPQWNECFKFFVLLDDEEIDPKKRLGRQASSEMVVELTLLNISKDKKEEPMGSCTAELNKLFKNKGTEFLNQPLTKSGKPVGYISFTMKPVGFGLEFDEGRLRCDVKQAVLVKEKVDTTKLVNPNVFVEVKVREEKNWTHGVQEPDPSQSESKMQSHTWNTEFNFRPDVWEVVLEDGAVVCCSADLVVAVKHRPKPAAEPRAEGHDEEGRLILGQGQVSWKELQKLDWRKAKPFTVTLHPPGEPIGPDGTCKACKGIEKDQCRGRLHLELEALNFGRKGGAAPNAPKP